jgi:hypothetical protein
LVVYLRGGSVVVVVVVVVLGTSSSSVLRDASSVKIGFVIAVGITTGVTPLYVAFGWLGLQAARELLLVVEIAVVCIPSGDRFVW